MENTTSDVKVYFVTIPAHKFLHIKNYESIGYWDFWQKQSLIPGHDCATICGLLDSIPNKLDDQGGTAANSSSGQIMDVLDYIGNYILMPVVALGTCILAGWVLKPKTVIDEVTKNGEKFRRAGLYKIMTCFISPIFIIVILLISLGIL